MYVKFVNFIIHPSEMTSRPLDLQDMEFKGDVWVGDIQSRNYF